MKETIYVVIAYRWNDNQNHSYTVYATTDLEKAKEAADSQFKFRCGKYTCRVEKVKEPFSEDADAYTETVYSTGDYL